MLLANAWADAGLHVELLLFQSGGRFLPLLDRRVVVQCANVKRVRQGVRWLKSSLARSSSIPVLAFSCDVGFVLGLLRRLNMLKCPTIYREWSIPTLNVSGGRRWMYPYAISQLDGVIAQTRYAGGQLRGLLGRAMPIACIPNPVPTVPRHIVRPSPKGDGIRVLCVGRLSDEKRHGLLLDVVAQPAVRARIHQVMIAGSGPLQQSIQERAASLHLQDIVKLVGFAKEMNELYDQCDLVVMPSRYEGMPNALLEAILHGCRVLASGGPAVKEILTRIGLGECYVEEHEWQHGHHPINRVMSLPASHFTAARARLESIVEVDTVARRYLDFCQSRAIWGSFV